MKAHLYKMTCLTNLHVGNGDVNYSIIDNEVEKDPVTQEAVIPSSGIKGALKDYAKDNNFEYISEVFGDDKDNSGKYKFLSAGLLARPVRVTEGPGAYKMCYSSEMKQMYIDICEGLGIENYKMIYEEAHWEENNLENESLPVIARNALDDRGISKNLWYEEYVPHHSVFYMIIITPGEENRLDTLINDKVVQFGADASIGFGLLKIEKVHQ